MPDDKSPQNPNDLSPSSPDEESRQIIKSTTEVRQFDSEESERRQTPEGTYEKKTTRSEVHETKTTSSETFEPQSWPVSSSQSRPVSGRSWQQGLPPQVKMEVVGTNKPDVYDADYIMHEVERSQERCRWQVEFPSQNGLHRAALEAKPNTNGTLGLRAYLEGRVEGPHWINSSVPDLSGPVELTFDAESGVTPSAGVDWPNTVSLTPLFQPIPRQGHFISPEPTAAEMAMMGAGSSSSGSGCIVFGIDPWGVPICVGADQQFTAQGDVLDELNWTTDPAGTPATGTGPTFTTKWTSIGLARKVTATCGVSGSFFEATVDVVGVDKVVVEGTANEGPVTINDGTSVLLRAKRTPAPDTGPWPTGKPLWEISKEPDSGFSPGVLELIPGDPGLVRFFPNLSPNEQTPATYKVKATCGTSSDEFTISVERCPLAITNVSADESYEKVRDTANTFNVVGARKGGEDRVALTISINPDTPANRNALSWEGAVIFSNDPNDPDYKIKATLAINESLRKDVVIKFNGLACKEIRVWPVWATITNFRGDNAQGEPLSPDNNPANGGLATGCPGLGTPATCAPGTFNQMEMRATITPTGVSALAGSGTSVQFDFHRTIQTKAWKKNAAYAIWTLDLGSVRPPGTPDDLNNTDEDLHDQNDVIWAMDSIGVLDGVADKDLFAFEAQAFEFVHLIVNRTSNKVTAMSGQSISDEQPWYSIVNVKKNVGTGKWERNPGRRNEIRIGQITIGDQPQ